MRSFINIQTGTFAILVLAVTAAASSHSVQVPASRGADDPASGPSAWAAAEPVRFQGHARGLVAGADGWVYTDEEFKTYPGAEAAVDAHLSLIPWVRDELARQGTELVVALVPAKARVYPEHLDDRRPAAIHHGLYAHAQRTLRAAGIAAPDLAEAMVRCKADHPTFLRKNPHWTPEGARCAAEVVAAAARSGTAPADAGPRTGGPALAQKAGRSAGFIPAADRVGAGHGATPPSGVVLVGAGYGADARWNLTGALQETLQQTVINHAADGQGPFLPMLEYLLHSEDLAVRPRVVVWEIPEHALPRPQDLRVERKAGVACAMTPHGSI